MSVLHGGSGDHAGHPATQSGPPPRPQPPPTRDAVVASWVIVVVWYSLVLVAIGVELLTTGRRCYEVSDDKAPRRSVAFVRLAADPSISIWLGLSFPGFRSTRSAATNS